MIAWATDAVKPEHRKIAYTTVMAMMGILETKKYLHSAPLFLRKRHLAQRLQSLLQESMSKARLISSYALMGLLLALTSWFTLSSFPLQGTSEAKEARIQSTVRLNALIGTDGRVTKMMVASGHPLLVPPALEAVKKWTYKPTLLNGQPVEVVTTIEVNFRLPE